MATKPQVQGYCFTCGGPVALNPDPAKHLGHRIGWVRIVRYGLFTVYEECTA